MLTEVDYLDMNGSVCWFCGCDLNIKELSEQSKFENINIKTYRCVCEQGHTSFIQHYINSDSFNIKLIMHLFIYVDDYFEYMGINPHLNSFKIIPALINVKDQ